MNILSTKNENKGKEFFNKKKMIHNFPESHDTIYKRFTLITGTNSDLRRCFVNNKLIDSFSKTNNTIIIDTKGMLDNNDICLLSSYYNMGGKLRIINVYEDGMPTNLFSLDPNKSDEEKAVDLFDVCSSIYSAPDLYHIEVLNEGMHVYVENMDDLTNYSVSETARIEKMQTFEFMNQALAYTIDDTFLYELHLSIESDLNDCGVLYNSWEDIIQYPGPAYYINLNSGLRDSAIPLANMLLASLRNHRKRNHDLPLDLYINDISDLNFSSTGPIRKIIDECERLNINVIGISRDYYSPTTPVGQIMASAEKQFFLFPTIASKEYVNSALQIGSGDEWPFENMLFGEAILKEIVHDPHTGKDMASVFKGNYRDFFSTQ